MTSGGRHPEVSVVIPTHDRCGLLGRAIDSCFAAAGELEVEVIVVDDGSADATPEFLSGYADRVLSWRHETPLGRGRARNDGLARARGRFVKFLDDDDYLEPGALPLEVARAEETGAAIVAGAYRSAGIDVQERVFLPPRFEGGVDSLLRGEAVPTGAALYRREAIQEVCWTEDRPKLDDWRFFLDAALAGGRVVPLDAVVYTWYVHPGQGTRATTLLDNAVEFYAILDELESWLRARGQLTDARRRRLAQYRYKELRVLGAHDRAAFETEVARIRTLDPSFQPVDEEREAAMRLLARLVGFRRATLLRLWLKRRLGRSE